MFETSLRERRAPAPAGGADQTRADPIDADPITAAEGDAWLWAVGRGLTEPLAATEAVEDAVSGLPGDQLARFLASLPPTAGVDGWTVVEAIKGYEKVTRWAAAQQLRWIAELAHRRPDGRSRWSRGDAVDPQDPLEGTPAERLMGRVGHDAAVEVAFALGESTRVAKDLIYQAVTLTQRLPRTLDALGTGDVSRRVAAVVADETSVLDDDVVLALDAGLAERVSGSTAPQARATVRRAVVLAHPRAAAVREAKARRQRCFEVDRQVVDGMGTFGGFAPIEDVIAIDARVRELAEQARTPDDDRSAAARRMDVVTDLLLGRVAPSAGPGQSEAGDREGRPWAVDVVVSLSTLRGLDDEPGELRGYGPITAGTARELAGAGVWRRLLTDPASGVVRDVGTQRYRPPPGLADLVRARDRVCHAPGCRQPAARCDLDHVLDSPAGPSPRPHRDGATADWNLGPLCRTHHTCKSRPDWRVTSPSPGAFRWRTPTGHTYATDPSPPLEPPLEPPF